MKKDHQKAESSMQIVICTAGTVHVHLCHYQLSASVKPYTTFLMPSDLSFCHPSLFTSSLPVYGDVMSHAIHAIEFYTCTTPASARGSQTVVALGHLVHSMLSSHPRLPTSLGTCSGMYLYFCPHRHSSSSIWVSCKPVEETR